MGCVQQQVSQSVLVEDVWVQIRPWEIMPKASCIMVCRQFLEM